MPNKWGNNKQVGGIVREGEGTKDTAKGLWKTMNQGSTCDGQSTIRSSVPGERIMCRNVWTFLLHFV